MIKGMKIYNYVKPNFCTFEIEPSKLTSNTNVRWLLSEISRIYRPLTERMDLNKSGISYHPSYTVWWEVLIQKDSIKFYISVPSKMDIQNTIS